MQCPFSGCTQFFPLFKILAGLISLLSLGLGIFSVCLPAGSIRLYQWIMARLNWQVAPIDMARELRNTRLLGVCLVLLGFLLGTLVITKY